MEQQQVAGRHGRMRGGWRAEEVDHLWQQVHVANDQGEPLRTVFERVGMELGRKPNSIRNFYYAQLKERQAPELQRALPFATFSEDEVRQLLRSVLAERAKGLSVRACVHQLAGGDKTLMLRYQNKYRSTIKSRPSLVREVIGDMEAAGEPYINPLVATNRRQQDPEPLYREAAETIQRIGDPALMQMLDGMNQLLQMALGRTQRDRTQELDRMTVRHDLARIALDDARREMEQLRTRCLALLTTIKEYLGMPEADRAEQSGMFCEKLGAHMASLEEMLPFSGDDIE